MLITDHKALITLFGPKAGVPVLAAARLQRWSLLLNAYNYDIQFKRTARHGTADGLSRLSLKDDPEVRMQPELEPAAEARFC